MDLDIILQKAFSAFVCCILIISLFKRLRWRRQNRRRNSRLGSSPATAALGLALLSLQTLVQPDLHHDLQQRQNVAADEDEQGNPDDPAAQLSSQLKRIRNGESLEPSETLKIPFSRLLKK